MSLSWAVPRPILDLACTGYVFSEILFPASSMAVHMVSYIDTLWSELKTHNPDLYLF
jgi:hypothetical protein